MGQDTRKPLDNIELHVMYEQYMDASRAVSTELGGPIAGDAEKKREIARHLLFCALVSGFMGPIVRFAAQLGTEPNVGSIVATEFCDLVEQLHSEARTLA